MRLLRSLPGAAGRRHAVRGVGAGGAARLSRRGWETRHGAVPERPVPERPVPSGKQAGR